MLEKSIYDFFSVLHISIDDKRLFFAFLSILPSVFMFVLKEMHLWSFYLSPLKDLILLFEILHAWPSPWGQSNKWNCQVAFFNKHMSPCKYLRTVKIGEEKPHSNIFTIYTYIRLNYSQLPNILNVTRFSQNIFIPFSF